MQTYRVLPGLIGDVHLRIRRSQALESAVAFKSGKEEKEEKNEERGNGEYENLKKVCRALTTWLHVQFLCNSFCVAVS